MKKIKVGLIIDEFFGGAGTAYGGYGFLARRLIAKYIPNDLIQIDVLLGRSNKNRYFAEKIKVDDVYVYKLPKRKLFSKLWLKKQNYDIYLSIELTYDWVLKHELDINKKLILWIQDPRPAYEWDEINTVKLFPETSYYNQDIYDLVHSMYKQNRVKFISQGYFLNEKAKEYSIIYPIAARCGVFAKTDIQPLINEGAKLEDLSASIFQAVVNQTISGLACGRQIKGKIAFISGASSGIGKATAEKLAQMGVNLILCARRENILNELKENLEKQYGVKVKILVFDVRNYNDVLKNINSLDDEWKKIDILVNNAGLAVGLEKIYQYDMEDVDRMVDTNIKGFTYIANTILPLMIATDKVCTVVNIGSVAGEIAYPNGSIYCATKFAVKAISDAMRSELIDKKIKVTNIKPGLVDTEFSLIRFKGDKTKADNVYKGIEPLYAEDIADTIAYIVNLPEKIQITDLTVTPLHQANAIHIHREK